MNSVRQEILNKNMSDLDQETKDIFLLAESICRREFEKKFDLNLDLPIGHPRNIMMYSNIKERNQHLYKVINFWEDLKDKYFGKCSDSLASAVAYFCDRQCIGFYQLLKK